METMTCKGIRYVIRQGDSLYKISRIYRVPLALILRANPYVDVYNLQVGDEICIPLTPQPLPRTQGGEQPDMPGNQPEAGMEFPLDGQNVEITTNPINRMGEQTERRCPEPNGNTEESMMLYVVQAGDTLEGLLERFSLSLEEFLQDNQPNMIQLAPGSTVKIPQSRIERQSMGENV